jgi:hypothetical protein
MHVDVDVGADALIEDDVGAIVFNVEGELVLATTLEMLKRFRRPFDVFALSQKLGSIMSTKTFGNMEYCEL